MMKLGNLDEHVLTEHSEYSVYCDDCDDESTRDGNMTLAIANAEKEGFVSTQDYETYCRKCAVDKGLVSNERREVTS